MFLHKLARLKRVWAWWREFQLKSLAVAVCVATIVALSCMVYLFHAMTQKAPITTPATSVARDNIPAVPSLVILADPAKRHRADQIISSFENSTTELQYGYVANIHDGRGYTAGRAGFTSGTGDMLQVVSAYTERKPQNGLAKYLPMLEKVNGSDSTTGLDGLPAAWKKTAEDPDFRTVQDMVVGTLYFDPAMAQARRANVTSALGELIIYDTIIQQGGGNDPDGLPAIITETNRRYPRGTVSEADWLQGFLSVRKYHLEHAADPATRVEWRESVDRVNTLHSFVRAGNLDLKPPLKWQVYGDSYSLDK